MTLMAEWAQAAGVEAVIKQEIGNDDGHELPDIAGITWGLDRIDL